MRKNLNQSFLKLILLYICIILLQRISNAQRVNVTLFTESQCPFCTRLLREQVWQIHTTRPGLMNLQVYYFY